MVPGSLRLTLSLTLLAVLGWPAVARGNHHHIGGSGSSGEETDADCLIWGYWVVDGGMAAGAFDAADADTDAAMSDAGNATDAAQASDAARTDAGPAPPPGATLVCLEHATMFGCDCAAGPAAEHGWPGGAVALVGAMMVAARRRRRSGAPGRAREDHRSPAPAWPEVAA
jgi:MYXO-CTERM domain-containing protein